MERALGGLNMPMLSIDAYTSERIKLFKLHGSVDWQLWFRKALARNLSAFNDQPPEQAMIDAAPPLDS
ncbi:MAG: hypothetical protein ACHP79_08290, partial [Terriglobales bacterium]